MKAGIGIGVLGAAAMVAVTPGRGLAADSRVTWAGVATPILPADLQMDARGIWTESGTLYGYDGKPLLKLANKRPWIGLKFAGVGSSIAFAGGEQHPLPKSVDWDATFALATTGLMDADAKPVWMQRWTRKAVEVQQEVIQVTAGPGGDVFVTGLYWGCTTFGVSGKKHCAKDDELFQWPVCFDDTGCQEPFRLQYDQAGQLKETRTFPGTGGTPTMGPGGELAIIGGFQHGTDVPTGNGKEVHFDPGLPGNPVDGNQALVLRYDARGSWRWGRAFVGERHVAMVSAAFASDGALWGFLGAGKTVVTGPMPVMVVGGKKPRKLMDDPGACGALLQFDDKAGVSIRQKICDEGMFGDLLPGKLLAARTSGVFLIVFDKGARMLDGARLSAQQIAVVADADPPADKKRTGRPSAVLWYRGARAVWGLRAPGSGRIRGAYDPSDGRVCVLIDVEGRQTWTVNGVLTTVGEAGKKTTQIGCFPVSTTP